MYFEITKSIFLLYMCLSGFHFGLWS